MTATYKGNTIGLNYDAANATWSFTNEPNDFIDPNSFSTADPAFDYTPPPSDDDDQDDDFNPCPEGYIYDSTLKQCVIDPNQQTSYQQDTGGGGSDQPDPTRVEFKEMTYHDMIKYGKDKEWFNEAGTYIGEQGTGWWTIGNHMQADRFAKEFAKKGGKVWYPNAPLKGNLYIPKRSDLAELIAGYGKDTDIASGYNKKIHDFQTVASLTASKISDYRYAEDQEAQNLIDQQIAQKNKFNLLKQRAATEKARLQSERERLKVEAEKNKLKDNERKMQQTIRDAEEREARLIKRQKDKEKGTGGSYGRDEDRPVIQPKKDTKPGGGGTSLGSSVHGTGSYNKPKSKSKPKPRPTHHF